MIITRLDDIRLADADHGDSVVIWLNPSQAVLVSTILEAHQVADAFRKAAWALEQRAMLINDRKDTAAARRVNELRRDINHAYGTLPQAFAGTGAPAVTETRTVHIDAIHIEACTCSRTDTCERHGGSDSAA